MTPAVGASAKSELFLTDSVTGCPRNQHRCAETCHRDESDGARRVAVSGVRAP